MEETFASILDWQTETFPNATIQGVLNHIDEEWKEFQNSKTPEACVEEAADLIILLSLYIAKVTGHPAQFALDEKMARNRTRQWKIQLDGTGRHT